MAQDHSRRSFLVDAINKSAGLWLALTGGAVLAAAPACSSSTGATGVGPTSDTAEDTALSDQNAPDVAQDTADAPDDIGPVAKYGGPPDAVQDSVDVPEDLGPVVKYGGPPDIWNDSEDAPDTHDIGPVVKYGGPPSQDVG